LVLLWRLTEPTLGNLVLCPEPKHTDRMVIGRMVGEEKNTVRVDGSRVVVNEKAFPTEGNCSRPRFTVEAPHDNREIEQRCSMEASHGLLHERGEAEATAELAVYEAEVQEGEVLLVSDNRRFPYDSRDFGPVDRATCTETIFFRLFGRKGFFDEAARFQYIR
jgi:hypothetical protein